MTKFKKFISLLSGEITVNNRKVREFGFVMLLIPGILIPALLGWRNDWQFGTISQVLFAFGFTLFFISMVRPVSIFSIYKGWMILALMLGLVMTKVIISLVFLLVMTPIGIGRRLLTKDPLGISINKSAETYWKDRTTDYSNDPGRYEKQY
ncbi:MAG: SxtJ family membrane protein [Balneolales bacterium]|nr:SxtJ family membrane protein [Balneolales bacterium]